MTLSAIGGFILLASGLLFLVILAARPSRAARRTPGAYRFSVAVHPPRPCRVALNGYALWVALMIGLTVTNYGYPIADSSRCAQDTSVPAVYVGAQR